MRSLRSWLAWSAHLTSLILLTVFTRRLIANVRFLRWARRSATTLPVSGPRVSVLLPARDEVTTITSCVASLLRQDYADIEVLVLDDGSTDDTGEQLDRLADEHPQLRVMHSHDDPPKDWNGKSYACFGLAERASGEWLLFTDADTIHTARSVGQGLAYAMAHGAALVSVFPRQQTVTWSERLMVSFILDFLPMMGLDLQAMQRGTSRRVAANGQYLLVHAPSYTAVGGHAGIRGALVDDFALAERFKSQGFTALLLDGTDMLSCRMYTSFRELWNGFAKNLLAGPAVPQKASRHLVWQAPVFAWGYACLFVIPFWHLVFAPDKRLPALEVCWLALLRGIVTGHLRRSPDEILTTPLSALGVMAIGLSALYRRLTRREIRWKGRIYHP